MGKQISKLTTAEAFDRIKSSKISFNNREKNVISQSTANPSLRPKKEYRSLAENVVLVWLDASSTQKVEATQAVINQFRRLTHCVETFATVNVCVEYLESIEKENLFVVVSGSLGPQLLAQVQNLSTIHSIYIFCGNRANHEQWVKAYPQIKGIYTNIKLLCEVLDQNIRLVDHSLTAITLLPPNSKLEFNASTASFLVSQLIKTVLLEQSSNETSEKRMLNFARPFYLHNSHQLALIDRWKQNYSQHSPISWFLRRCFVYYMMRRAFQDMEYDKIFYLSHFIEELHRDIRKSYAQIGSLRCRPVSVYRAAYMTKTEFALIQQQPRTLLAFNDFLLTTVEKQLAFKFAQRIKGRTNELITVIYRIDLDPKKSSIPYVPLDHLSNQSNENGEILLSMNTVFFVVEVARSDDGIFEVLLEPASRKDDEIVQVVELLDEWTMNLTGWYRLSRVLIETKAYRSLECIYQSLFDETDPSRPRERAFLQHELGYLAQLQEEWKKSIDYYKQSIAISLTYSSPTDPNLRATYANLAFVFEQIGDFDGAKDQCRKIMNMTAPDDPSILHLYIYLGNLLRKEGKHLDSQQTFEKARTLLAREFPSAEQILADIFHSIAGTFYQMKDYGKAIEFYQKAIHIDEKHAGLYHPSSAATYFNLATVYYAENKIPQATECAKKAFDLARKIYGNEHHETRHYREFHEKLLLHPPTDTRSRTKRRQQ